jgi:mannose-6-phosphate isomerase
MIPPRAGHFPTLHLLAPLRGRGVRKISNARFRDPNFRSLGAESLGGGMETDHRPWGYYTVLADEPDHKVKRICVFPGKRLSLQRHRRRAEHWYLVRGEAIVTIGDRELALRPGEAVDIPCGAAHRLRNTGEQETAFIEVQTGEYFGEDDIERLADDYGRV